MFVVFQRLIKHSKQHNRTQKGVFVVGSAILGVALLAIPSFSYASLFPRAYADTPVLDTESLQSMPLLEAAGMPGETSSSSSYTSDGALIADAGPEGTILDVYEVPASDLITQYTVKQGDTLATIAKLFDVSPNTIRWANGLSAKDSVKPGQELLILPITGVRHKVVKGDTVASLAKKYNGDADDIASYNGIGVAESLSVGDIVIIPDGEVAAIPAKSTKSSNGKTGYDKATGKYYTVTNTSLNGPSAGSGYFIRPVAGIKTQGFHGPYNAVDIGAKTGTPVYAAAEGTVIAARGGYNGGYGNMVIIKHPNGAQSLYAHLSKISVSNGESVNQGQLIGAVGSTGRSTGPHLHLEFRGIKTPVLY